MSVLSVLPEEHLLVPAFSVHPYVRLWVPALWVLP